MRSLLWVLLLSGSCLLAQSSDQKASEKQAPANSEGSTTVQGCVDRSRGDYVLIQTNPGMTYLLRSTGKIKLNQYMGKQVEVTGAQSTSLSTSSDSIAFGGSPSPLTLSVKSIKTLAEGCVAHSVGR